jgi:hypothetical protein
VKCQWVGLVLAWIRISSKNRLLYEIFNEEIEKQKFKRKEGIKRNKNKTQSQHKRRESKCINCRRSIVQVDSSYWRTHFASISFVSLSLTLLSVVFFHDKKKRSNELDFTYIFHAVHTHVTNEIFFLWLHSWRLFLRFSSAVLLLCRLLYNIIYTWSFMLLCCWSIILKFINHFFVARVDVIRKSRLSG